jgi:hypothetical protein
MEILQKEKEAFKDDTGELPENLAQTQSLQRVSRVHRFLTPLDH